MNRVTKIRVVNLNSKITPVMVIAYRRGMSPVMAGNSTLATALKTLFFLLTDEMLNWNQIKRRLLSVGYNKVDRAVWRVL